MALAGAPGARTDIKHAHHLDLGRDCRESSGDSRNARLLRLARLQTRRGSCASGETRNQSRQRPRVAVLPRLACHIRCSCRLRPACAAAGRVRHCRFGEQSCYSPCSPRSTKRSHTWPRCQRPVAAMPLTYMSGLTGASQPMAATDSHGRARRLQLTAYTHSLGA